MKEEKSAVEVWVDTGKMRDGLLALHANIELWINIKFIWY